MSSNFLAPAEIAEAAAKSGEDKANSSILKLLVLGFLAGAFIAMGFILDIRVTASLPEQWGSLKSLIGGAVFPIGLMFVIIAGGELLTGNMMTVPLALHKKRVKISGLIYNWVFVLIGNFLGSIFMAGLGIWSQVLSADPYKSATIALATSKATLAFGPTIASAIGCNWLVCLAVWMALGSKDIISKIFAIWFPVMAFVAIGFQHVVANMFIIPAAIWLGADISWGQAIVEWCGAFIGNAIGGWLFVGVAYYLTYLRGRSKAGATDVSEEQSTGATL
ncbi:putative transporter YrhG [Alicyclobacillus acidoterrestris]|uniref:formate/nitrite transporter family protein n=1 Tax=Alicyclobacillus suci TaxID=2816080 RepID=UPI0011946318|nr:formate/nitrite transporter family protein [Alicyclobacillus suci]GEO27717.1 putative transporter YrhG [Alicyclobacillus acidoterrestris]